jgi:CSLREA domain-containing protein
VARAPIALLAAVLFLLLAGTASAASFTVNSTADAVDANPGNGICETAPGNGLCTLRAAVQEANATTAADTISVPAGHYTFGVVGTGENAAATGDLDITHDLTIAGAGARGTVIDPGGIDRAFEIRSGASLLLSGVTITNGFVDDSGGAIFNSGSLTLSDSTVRGNSVNVDSFDPGGGIYSAGPITITRSAIVGNLGYNGGGLSLHDDSTITDTTVSGNRGGNFLENGDGGGIDIGSGTINIVNSTIVNNSSYAGAGSGGGVSGFATFKNTIVARNLAYDATTTDPPVLDNCSGGESSGGHNIEDGNTCAFSASGDVQADPLLGPLVDNGGPSDTYEPLAGSPAIDHGDNSGCPTTDQRGIARPQGAACDVGAYESAPPSVLTSPAAGVTADAAVLAASVDPNDLVTSYHFEFGTTTAYGSTTPATSAGTGTTADSVSAAVRGLAPGTTYHYRVVATSADGTAAGGDQAFTTAPAPDTVAPGVVLGRLPGRMKLKAFLRGIAVKVGSDEPSSFDFELKGFARRVTLARTFNLTLARKTLRLGSGTRSVKLKPARRLVSRNRRFSVQLVVTATDAAGNTTRRTRTIKVAA